MPPPPARRTADAQVLVGDTFERNGDLAARIEFFAWHTSASRVEWPSPEDKRSLAVRIEYPNASLLYAAFQTNNRCPGQWGFFVTRAPPPVQQPPAVSEEPASDPQRPVVRRGHGRGEQQFSNPKLQAEERPCAEKSSAASKLEYTTLPVHPEQPSADESSAVSTIECTIQSTIQSALHDSDIPTLVVPHPYSTSRPAESAGAPGLAAASPAPSWDEAESDPRLASPSCPDSLWDDVARPRTAPPQEIPCRHTFIHYPSQPTPGARRHRSLSAPALPLSNREWDLDFARQMAFMYAPLSRCVIPIPDIDVDVTSGDAPVAPQVPFPDSLDAAAPASPLGGRSLATVPPEGESESSARSSLWKPTHRGVRGGRKGRWKKTAPEEQQDS